MLSAVIGMHSLFTDEWEFPECSCQHYAIYTLHVCDMMDAGASIPLVLSCMVITLWRCKPLSDLLSHLCKKGKVPTSCTIIYTTHVCV